MKNLKYIFSFILLAVILSCSQDENSTGFLDSVKAPSNLSAIFTITHDNSGLVTIRPDGEGVTIYKVLYGDATNEFGEIQPGATATHKYAEGVYTVKIIATGINGLTTEYTQQLTVTFIEPQNLEVTITPDATDTHKMNVTAKADFETYFDVTFGDDPSASAVSFNEGQTVSHTYTTIGTYNIKVIAYSGGAAFKEYNQSVTITNLVPAPTPLVPAANVISMFSDAYTNVPVDTWKTSWSQANLDDITINGNATKKYSALNFVGIETTSTPIDATGMTNFHTDVWSSDFTEFKVKLVDFGADGAFGGGDDVEHEITIPNPAKETWVSLDFPLSDFTGLVTRAHISQLIFAASPSGNNTVYIDNIYFYNQSGNLTVAPTPTLPAANVISMFSDAYTNIAVDTWKTSWSSATLEDITLNGNKMKKYSSLDFVGIETAASPIDATGMTHFHTDVWSSDFTVFKLKLVDFGANGIFGGGDDVEHEITISNPAKNSWISLDIPLSDFTGLTTRAHIAQLIYAATPTGNNTIFIDNVYFHN